MVGSEYISFGTWDWVRTWVSAGIGKVLVLMLVLVLVLVSFMALMICLRGWNVNLDKVSGAGFSGFEIGIWFRIWGLMDLI